jgi:predicted nucleic acid-binding protein
MIILDTNVVSELASLEPDPRVVAWFSEQLGTGLYITSINEAKLLSGIEKLPAGRRRDAIAVANEK